MLRALNAGAIHVSVHNLDDGIAACRIGGFDCLAMNPGLIEGASIAEIRESFFDAMVAPGAWGIPFDWRGTQETYDAGFAKMVDQTKKMAAVGVKRCATWIMPGSNELDLAANSEFHYNRLAPIGKLLDDNGMILGLEFVGPKTTRDKFLHPFFYDLNGMYSFAQTVGPNVGLLVDAWHMHTSGSSMQDLEKIPAERIALVHINDAPPNTPVDELLDHKRCLPCETGVIDMAGFMSALRYIGYEGPVEAEPFDDMLKEMESDTVRLQKVGRTLANAFNAR